MKTLPLLLIAGAIATACATTQAYSYLNGFRWSKVEANTYDVLIVSVDGVTRAQNAKLLVEPGVRTLILEAPPADGFRRGEQRELVLRIDPCMECWFEAKRSNPLSQDWEPRVNYRDRIAGCKP